MPLTAPTANRKASGGSGNPAPPSGPQRTASNTEIAMNTLKMGDQNMVGF